MNSKIFLLIAAAVLLSSCAGRYGGYGDHDNGRHKDRMMEYLDSDDSGGISVAEGQAHAEKVFGKLDDNDDGVLDDEELDSRYGWRLRHFLDDASAPLSRDALMASIKGRHQQFDSNEDGDVTFDEFHQGMRMRHFKQLDSDTDGSVSQDEFMAWQPRHGMGRKGMHWHH